MPEVMIQRTDPLSGEPGFEFALEDSIPPPEEENILYHLIWYASIMLVEFRLNINDTYFIIWSIIFYYDSMYSI